MSHPKPISADQPHPPAAANPSANAPSPQRPAPSSVAAPAWAQAAVAWPFKAAPSLAKRPPRKP